MTQTARFQDTAIPGVQLKPLTTHADERGFFREIIRAGDEFFSEGFGQWSHSVMYDGEPVIKAWHIHQKQTDWFYCPIGVIKVALCKIDAEGEFDNYHDAVRAGYYSDVEEFLLGDNQPPQVLRIPPGVAHGLKVLQGPAHLFYVTSREYGDGSDEGRIAYDALGYDWNRRDIR